MAYHLGKKVKEVAESKGISQTALGKMVNLSKPGVASMYKRTGIDTDLLIKLIEALDFDFLSYVYEHEKLKKYKKAMTMTYNAQMNSFKSEINSLSQLVSKNDQIIELQNKRISELEKQIAKK